MKYDGDNAFVSTTIDLLNAINDTNGGKTVLTALTDSKNSFDFTNTKSAGGAGTLQLEFSHKAKYKEGGAEIHASELTNKKMINEQKVEYTAHEVFHGYQRENARNPATINGEVGAYLFGRGVASGSKYAPCGIAGYGNNTKIGDVYNNAMVNMLFGDDPNNGIHYKTAINNFLIGSSVNSNGMYNKHRISSKYKPLILKFLPLIK